MQQAREPLPPHGCALGGVTGADAICQARAAAAGLPGTYMAWLADANGSPATRMTHHLGVYQLVTGAAIAQGWSDQPPDGSAPRRARSHPRGGRGGRERSVVVEIVDAIDSGFGDTRRGDHHCEHAETA